MINSRFKLALIIFSVILIALFVFSFSESSEENGDKTQARSHRLNNVLTGGRQVASERNRGDALSSRVLEICPLSLADWDLSDSDMKIVEALDARLKDSERDRIVDSGDHYRTTPVSERAKESLGIPSDIDTIVLLVIQAVVRTPTSDEEASLLDDITQSVNSLAGLSAAEKDMAENFFKMRYFCDEYKFKLIENRAYQISEVGVIKSDYMVWCGDDYGIVVPSDDKEGQSFAIKGTPVFENTTLNPDSRSGERYDHIDKSKVGD